MATEDRDYHVERARQELDLSYRAEGRLAAAAHMRLAALHMASVEPGVAEHAFGGQQAVHAPISNAR
jgi:hypothetical protein